MVVSQLPAQPLVTGDLSAPHPDFIAGLDDLIIQTLVIPLGVIVIQVGSDGSPQRRLAEKYHS